jgi:hypothetical protein
VAAEECTARHYTIKSLSCHVDVACCKDTSELLAARIQVVACCKDTSCLPAKPAAETESTHQVNVADD